MKNRKLDRHKKIPKICINCKINYVGRRNRKFCSKNCFKEYARGKYACNWKGGKPSIRNGYIWVRLNNGIYKAEHVLIAEKALGRKLKSKEIVHHINGSPSDNRNKNLLICDRSFHAYLHWKMAQLYMKEHFS